MGRELRGLVPEGVGNFLLQSFHEVKQMAEKQTGSGNGTGNFIVEKWHQFLLLLQNIAVFLAEKLEHILPPGARSETLHHWFVAVCLVLFAAVILLITVPVLLCCLKCLIHLIKGVVTAIFSCLVWICSCFVGCLTMCFPCFFSSGVRMMRAPGRPGVWIPRAAFESNPGEYFRLLHAEV